MSVFPQLRATGAAPTHAPLRRPLVLVAENNLENLSLLVDYLDSKGFRTLTTTNGNEAVRLAAISHPDLLLVDIQMPGLCGFDVIKRIRSNVELASTPIVVLTAMAMRGDRERCLEAGASAYVSKPFSLRQLVELLWSYL